jgi:hypothetical protein
MGTLTIKNKSLKMSPGGLISLSVAARKGLGMAKGRPGRIGISTDGKAIVLKGNAEKKDAFYVSSKGLTVLRGKEKELLSNADKRHYWMEVNDDQKEVRLYPF